MMSSTPCTAAEFAKQKALTRSILLIDAHCSPNQCKERPDKAAESILPYTTVRIGCNGMQKVET